MISADSADITSAEFRANACVNAPLDFGWSPKYQPSSLSPFFAVEYASGLRDTQALGAQDPYVILQCGGQKFTSRVITGEHCNQACAASPGDVAVGWLADHGARVAYLSNVDLFEMPCGKRVRQKSDRAFNEPQWATLTLESLRGQVKFVYQYAAAIAGGHLALQSCQCCS